MTLRKFYPIGDETGSTAIEAAIAIPVFLAFLGAIVQLGMVMFVQSSLDHATGEAARFATIYPTPAASDIQTKASAAMFGGSTSELAPVTVTQGTDDGRNYIEITMTYNYPLVSWFIDDAAYTLTQTRRAYVQ